MPLIILVSNQNSATFRIAPPAINDSMLPLPGLSPVAGKNVVVKFDDGRLSSDGEVLILREIEGRLRVAERMAGCIEDPRASNHVTHSMADIIRFCLLMIAAGYEDGNGANSLRSGPMFKMALDPTPSDREPCSQPTITRLENLPDARALLRMRRAMVDLYCGFCSRVPRRIVLDIDDTFDAIHGGQQLRLFNARYDEYGFQPIVVFEGEGRFITAVLRPAKRPGGKEIMAFLRRLLRAIRANRPQTEIPVRGVRSRGSAGIVSGATHFPLCARTNPTAGNSPFRHLTDEARRPNQQTLTVNLQTSASRNAGQSPAKRKRGREAIITQRNCIQIAFCRRAGLPAELSGLASAGTIVSSA